MLFICSTTVHYINEIRIARHDTPLLIETALKRYGAELTIADLSPSQKSFIIAIEDPTFYRHHGVDLTTPGAGMTTITQGLVKLMYFPEGFRQGIAKIRQTLIAQYALDSLVSKDEQMRLFLNIAYLGHADGIAVHGFQSAARVYFHIEFTDLSDDEFLSIVAMLIEPNNLKPGTASNTERVLRIRKYLSGQYQPAGLLDVDYNGKRHGTIPEEALMAFLRLVTTSKPG